MKKTAFLLILIGFSALAFAQQKNQFGFIAKVGNYTIPGSKIDPAYTYGLNKRTLEQSLGSVYAIGVWHAFPLGQYLRLNSELIYRNARYTFKEHGVNYYFEDPSVYIFEQKQDVQINSFSLPVKLEFSFKKKSKLSFSAGAGLTLPFASTVRTRHFSQSSAFPPSTNDYTSRFSSPDFFSLQFNLNAGAVYRIDPNTSIGLEYTLEKQTEENLLYDNRALIDCFCYYAVPQLAPKMNSFALVLRHNILAKQ